MNYLARLYSKDLATVTRATIDRYMCPLSGQIFKIEDQLEELSTEHILPRALGGTETILVERRINSALGESCDVHLINYVALLDVLAGTRTAAGAPLRASLSANGLTVPIELKIGAPDSAPTCMRIDRHRCNPKTIRDFWSQKESFNSLQITLASHHCSVDKAHLGCCKAAFLLCFKVYGYKFLFSDLGLALRALIRGQQSPMNTALLAGARVGPPLNFCRVYPRISMLSITEPLQYRGHLLIFRPKNSEQAASYLIPPPDMWGAFMPWYERWLRVNNIKKQIPLKVMPLAHDYLSVSLASAATPGPWQHLLENK